MSIIFYFHTFRKRCIRIFLFLQKLLRNELHSYLNERMYLLKFVHPPFGVALQSFTKTLQNNSYVIRNYTRSISFYWKHLMGDFYFVVRRVCFSTLCFRKLQAPKAQSLEAHHESPNGRLKFHNFHPHFSNSIYNFFKCTVLVVLVVHNSGMRFMRWTCFITLAANNTTWRAVCITVVLRMVLNLCGIKT